MTDIATRHHSTREGDVAHVTPTTVKRERYGSIIGTVLEVSDYPVTKEAVQKKVGNAEVAQRLTAGGDKIEVTVELTRSDTGEGFKWTSGKDPEIDITLAHVTPTTVKRERYGSIIGTVLEVSDYPVTKEAVQKKVGNAEVAQRLTAGGDKIEVTVELTRSDTGEGFKWTSGKDPEIDITAGMNVTVRTKVDERTPISFVIPILRQWSGS